MGCSLSGKIPAPMWILQGLHLLSGKPSPAWSSLQDVGESLLRGLQYFLPSAFPHLGAGKAGSHTFPLTPRCLCRAFAVLPPAAPEALPPRPWARPCPAVGVLEPLELAVSGTEQPMAPCISCCCRPGAPASHMASALPSAVSLLSPQTIFSFLLSHFFW